MFTQLAAYPERMIRGIVAAIATLLIAAPASSARLDLHSFALPSPGKPRSITVGPDRALWFTSDFIGNRIGRITTRGKVKEFALPHPDSQPDTIVSGPGRALWFTERGGDRIGRITPAGKINEFSVPTPDAEPRGITVGPDGALWFAEFTGNRIGRITPAGKIREFTSGISPGSHPLNIARGPRGDLWFTMAAASLIGHITTAGIVHEFFASTQSNPEDITQGPDHAMWFTENVGNRIGRISEAGKVVEFQSNITPLAQPFGIITGPDKALWFTEFNGNGVGRITPSGIVTHEFDLPHGSTPMGIVRGPDGAMWVAAFGSNKVLRFSVPIPPVVPGSAPFKFSQDGNTTTFSELAVTGVPRGGRIQVTCSGGGCPSNTLIVRGSGVDLRKRYGRLRTGAMLRIRLSATGFSTFVRTFLVRSESVDVTTGCQPPGSSRLRRKCG